MKFGLALGGGGARGAAHIGVLIELEKLGLKPDIVLAVDLANSAPFGTEVPFPKPNNFLTRLLTHAQRQPMYQAVSTLADILTSQNLDNHLEEAQPDLMLRPEIGTIGLFDFHRLDEGIAVGREAAQAAEPQLREFAARMNKSKE